jgi:two-component system NtrC family response regulator
VDALRASGWNRSRAARRLGVPRHILLYRMKKFSIREESDASR